MNEFRVECFIEDNDNKITKLSNLKKKEIEIWKRSTEKRALSEYYNKKVEILNIIN